MIRISVLALSLMMVAAPAALAHAAGRKADSPTTITSCGTIKTPGNYILADDLVLTVNNPAYGGGGDCLDINASHVNIDMQGWSITVSCPESCSPEEYGPVGSDGVHIMNGANNVSISNGEVDNFLYGLVAEGNHTFVADFITFNAVVGISLNGASNGAFSDISFGTGGLPYNFSVGPMLSVVGGGNNSFSELTDSVGDSGIEIMDSSHNVISGADISSASEGEAGPGILLTGNSGHNSIIGSDVNVLDGNGIEVDLGSDHNAILYNTVSVTSPAGDFALVDKNPKCGHDVWASNSFTSANPTTCVH